MPSPCSDSGMGADAACAGPEFEAEEDGLEEEKLYKSASSSSCDFRLAEEVDVSAAAAVWGLYVSPEASFSKCFSRDFLAKMQFFIFF